MKRTLKIVATVVLPAGWLLPAWAAVKMFIMYFDEEVADLLRGHQPISNFPFMIEAERWAIVAFVWLGVVLLFWAAVGASRLFPKIHAEPEPQTVGRSGAQPPPPPDWR
jgi:hypothetical protein